MTAQGLPTLQRLGAGVLPIPTFVVHRAISGLPTELSIQVYDDRIMVLLSQLGNKVGCLVSHFNIGVLKTMLTAGIRTQTQASLPASIPLTTPRARAEPTESNDASTNLLSMLPTPSPSISLLPLVGAPLQPTRHDFFVSQIATVVWWLSETSAVSGTQSSSRARRPVVVGLALKHDRGTASPYDGEQDEFDILSSEDRHSFAEIISMVAEWPGA